MRLLRKSLPLLIVLSAAFAAPAGAQAAGLSATFSTSSDWGSGFVGPYTITNGGTSPVTGWRLEFDQPVKADISSTRHRESPSPCCPLQEKHASWHHQTTP